jgi:hypothetical protein
MMDVKSYDERVSEVTSEFDLEVQVKKARILANLLAERAHLAVSGPEKAILQEAALEATDVQWRLGFNYFDILKTLKGEKEKPEMEMKGREGVINGNGPTRKG